MNNEQKVKRLQEIKNEMSALSEEKKVLVEELDELVIFQNDDKTWTRFKKVDLSEQLKLGKPVFYPKVFISQYLTEVKVLKNKPRELKD